LARNGSVCTVASATAPATTTGLKPIADSWTQKAAVTAWAEQIHSAPDHTRLRRVKRSRSTWEIQAAAAMSHRPPTANSIAPVPSASRAHLVAGRERPFLSADLVTTVVPGEGRGSGGGLLDGEVRHVERR
jgi:hypothetical protein